MKFQDHSFKGVNEHLAGSACHKHHTEYIPVENFQW